jgi:phage terminase large subunit
MWTLKIETPRWSVPLLRPNRIKGAKGGRSSGKSHTFAEMLVEEHIHDKDLQSVCIREIQKSLKFSAKKLIESKIREFGVSHLFEITLTEIRRVDGHGLIIFQGMQDHTADSIKSLEGFDRAWVEEAQSISKRSLELLEPTIRKDGSEIWFTWNPDQPTDPVEQLFNDTPDAILVHVNYTDNPKCPSEMIKLAEKTKRNDPDKYAHIWLGQFNTKSEKQILNGKWRVAEFEPQADWDGAYFGMDHGFATDPMTLVKCWIAGRTLYIEKERFGHGIEIADMVEFVEGMPEAVNHTIRADSARPEINSHLRNAGLNVVSVEKWAGSVEDGITFLRSFDEIVIHSSCTRIIEESRLWSYKTDRLTGDIMPQVVDDYNHGWDAIRYALQPLIKQEPAFIMEFA